MKTRLVILISIASCVLAGCKAAPSGAGKWQEGLLSKGKIPLTVDFQKDQSLRYKFVSSRSIDIDWEPNTVAAASTRKKQENTKHTESMEMVVKYEPVEIDPYGSVTIKATCESVNARHTSSSGRDAGAGDAVQSLTAKTFTFKVGPTGKIEDYSQLDALIKETGEKAFRQGETRGRIKEPDMIGDFIATQWFLWNSISSIEEPYKGVSIGQTWRSQLSVPSPMMMRKARDVTYTLKEVRESPKGRLAVIQSNYTAAESAPEGWPVPYKGRFRMSGTFGFLQGYQVQDLQGNGEELFNIDKGRIEQYNQNYKMHVKCRLPMGLDVSPEMVVNQKLTMTLLPDSGPQ